MGSIPRDSHRWRDARAAPHLHPRRTDPLVLITIDALVCSYLLEERSTDAAFSYDTPGTLYMLKWAFDNELGLVFVAVYHRFLNLTFIDDLLSNVRREFAEIYDPKRTAFPGFDETFVRLQREAEVQAAELKKLKQVGKPALPAACRQRRRMELLDLDWGMERRRVGVATARTTTMDLEQWIWIG